MNYFPNYYSIEDIFVTQEKVECKVNTKLQRMGFLDSGAEGDDLEPGRTVNLPLWYIKELKVNNAYFTVSVPDIYKNVHKAVCEAETTHIELGRLHPYFYEFGRYLTPYDRNHVIGRIIFETMRQRVRHLLDISKNDGHMAKSELRLDNIEAKLHEAGVRTNTQYINWLQLTGNKILISELVEEHQKKRKRELSDDESSLPSSKRATL
ncbi:probable DNA replication complex GINS protein PSF3 isoform X2 [Drosophila guanche]|uniref:DNA replication complex GINS protein PSF3 n=1 Tax=Drosophila guanche TaxID=7266 RepID=A0A3B0KZB3_DROGU|nr:probable DNA replication complex GINS protein PSF3 isoform X1 [Drosophila guanche]XP_034139897.1 probable DNA replication complex GINS protein PSF3 isoform X2 [Drosophila guanche]SPP89418.1 blast:DNA replication complex GINS protein PSF3 [Drosophila guanche]